jgi:hypothetical protein
MTFGPYPLPSARRNGHESLDRYVRHEYREDSAYWLTTINDHGTRIGLPSGRLGDPAQDNSICSIQTRQAETVSGCPVLNAVSKGARSRYPVEK